METDHCHGATVWSVYRIKGSKHALTHRSYWWYRLKEQQQCVEVKCSMLMLPAVLAPTPFKTARVAVLNGYPRHFGPWVFKMGFKMAWPFKMASFRPSPFWIFYVTSKHVWFPIFIISFSFGKGPNLYQIQSIVFYRLVCEDNLCQ